MSLRITGNSPAFILGQASPAAAPNAAVATTGATPGGVDISDFASAPVLPSTSAPASPRAAAGLPAAFSGPNADRAEATQQSLSLLLQSNALAPDRLPASTVTALVDGVARPRTDAGTGAEGVLGRHQALEAANTLLSLSPASFSAVQALLDAAGGNAPGADGDTERALLLKAVAAAAPDLTSSQPQNALTALSGFADAIRGMPRDALVQATSPLDLDNTVNASTQNPLRVRGEHDTLSNDDGLVQRYADTCVPTSSQLVRAEADPIFALSLTQDGLQSFDLSSPTAVQQEEVLDKDRFYRDGAPITLSPSELAAFQADGTLPAGVTHRAGLAVSRLATQLRLGLNQMEAAAVRTQRLSDTDVELIEAALRGTTLPPEQVTRAAQALEILRGLNAGAPSEDDLAVLRTNVSSGGQGMQVMDGLADIAESATHLDYQLFGTPGAALSTGEMNTLETALANGEDVPFVVGTPGESSGHNMVFTDVRGTAPNRALLVADPWSGRTAWVSEASLAQAGAPWLKQQFALGYTKVMSVFLAKS